MKIPIGLVHGKDTYRSVADLEIRPWIEVHNDQGVTPLSDHLFRYQAGDLVFHIFVDPQDNRKGPSSHFRGWQGNVLVVHEVNGQVVEACDDDMDLVSDAVRRYVCLLNHLTTSNLLSLVALWLRERNRLLHSNFNFNLEPKKLCSDECPNLLVNKRKISEHNAFLCNGIAPTYTT